MKARDCFKFLVGDAESIRIVARSRSALGTGVVLVLLTAIARNYDQTFIGDNPLLWLFGPLLFSVVSGTWLYAVAYGGFARRWMGHDATARPAFWSGWRSFMGLFWMTAPIAWLYAIPVERFYDSLTAARLNLTLLAIVSLWRVLLMTRVFSVLCRARTPITLFWVLVPAAAEVVVVVLFGGGIAKSILAGMGGMRNSPEEDLIMEAMGGAFMAAFWSFPVFFVVAMVWRPKELASPLPTREASAFPTRFVVGAALCWVGIAVLPQQELSRNAAVEKLVRADEWRAALDYLSARQPGDFAPSRTLPPKPYEREVFGQVPNLINAMTETDAAWVRAHLLRRLDEMCSHFEPRYWADQPRPATSREQQVNGMVQGIRMLGVRDPWEMAILLDSLRRFPEGRAWLGTNGIFLEAMGDLVNEGLADKPARTNPAEAAGWSNVADKLRALGVTNFPATNAASPADARPK